ARKGWEFYTQNRFWPPDGEVTIEGLKYNIPIYAEQTGTKGPLPEPGKFVDQSYLYEAVKQIKDREVFLCVVRAAGPFTHRGERFHSLANFLLGVNPGELSLVLENTSIDHDGIDIDRLCLLNEQDRRIAKGRGIEVVSSHQDHVGALAGRERADSVGDAQIFRSLERRQCQNARGL